MSLYARLTEDLKLAMKSRDQLRMDVIRMIKAAVLNKEVELKIKTGSNICIESIQGVKATRLDNDKSNSLSTVRHAQQVS